MNNVEEYHQPDNAFNSVDEIQKEQTERLMDLKRTYDDFLQKIIYEKLEEIVHALDEEYFVKDRILGYLNGNETLRDLIDTLDSAGYVLKIETDLPKGSFEFYKDGSATMSVDPDVVKISLNKHIISL